MARNPTVSDADLILSITELAKIITSICSWRVFEGMIVPKIPKGEDAFPEPLHMVMRSAIMDTVLLNIRCLDEFLIPGGQKDDIRASNFNGCTTPSFLTKPERDSINKHLAHMTSDRVQNPQQGWDLDDLAKRGLLNGINFLEAVGKYSGLTLPSAIENDRLKAIDLAKKIIFMIDQALAEEAATATKA